MNKRKWYLTPVAPLFTFMAFVIIALAWAGAGGSFPSSSIITDWGNLIANWLIALATITAVALVYATLLETRAMLEEAKETTAAAQATAETAFLEQRPWIEPAIEHNPFTAHPFEGALHPSHPVFEQKAFAINLTIALQNHGKSPALDVQSLLLIGIGKPPSKEKTSLILLAYEHQKNTHSKSTFTDTIMPGKMEFRKVQ